MDFLHQKLLQARTKDQEDKIVNWMLAEAQSKQSLKNKHSLINSSSQKNSDLHLQKK